MDKFRTKLKSGFAGMTKREKIMIFCLALIIIVAMGWRFVIMPSLDRYSTAQENYAAAKLQYDQMKNTIDAEDENVQTAEEYTKKTKIMNQSFRKVIADYQIDMLLTGYVTGCGLTPESLVIENEPSGSTADRTSGTSDSTAGASGSTASGGDASGAMTSTSYVKVRYAVITAYGSLPDCTALADKLRIGKGIRVVSFQISGGGSTAAAGSAAAGTAAKTTASYSITITAEVHMSRSK